MSIKGDWSLFRVPLREGKSEVQFTVVSPDLDRIPVASQLKDGPIRLPGVLRVPFRCMIQAQERLANVPIANEPNSLPNRWGNVLRSSVDVTPPAEMELKSTKEFEAYTLKVGEKVFTDSDAAVASLPAELAGCKGIRFPKSQAAKDAALSFVFAKPMRIVAAFGKGAGYLPPPEGWTCAKRSGIELTDPMIGGDLYILNLPKGEATLFSQMSGAYALLALVEQPANLALKCPVSVQSTHDNRNRSAHVTDGDIKTEWWSANGLPQWAQVDMGREKQVSCVHVIFHHRDERSYRYKIETSKDGKDWQSACDAAENQSLSTASGFWHGFEARPARFVRVTVTGGSGRVNAAHICELEVYDDRLTPLCSAQ